MTQSILLTIKPLVNIDVENHDFDIDVITHINTAITTLDQLGACKTPGFMIYGEEQTWDDLYSSPKLNMIRTYIQLSVKIVFDPPASSTVLKAIQEKISELELRIRDVAEDIRRDGSKK